MRLFGEGPVTASDYEIGVFPHFSFEQLPDQSVDLVFNSCSFSEMDSETSSHYLHIIERVCRRYLFHVNHDIRLTFDSEEGGRSVNRLGSELIPDPRLFRAVFKRPRVFGRPDDRFYPAHEFLYERIKALDMAQEPGQQWDSWSNLLEQRETTNGMAAEASKQ